MYKRRKEEYLQASVTEPGQLRYAWVFFKEALSEDNIEVLRRAGNFWSVAVEQHEGFWCYYCKALIEGYRIEDLVNLHHLPGYITFSIFAPSLRKGLKRSRYS